MFDVSRDEPGYFAAWGTLRLNQQSQFRRPARARWANSSCQSGDGGSRGRRGTFCGCAAVGLQIGFEFRVPVQSTNSKLETRNQKLETNPCNLFEFIPAWLFRSIARTL